jgi:hypothetical protein
MSTRAIPIDPQLAATGDGPSKVAMVLADPAVSCWLKDALRGALRRDPVDAYRDARLLVELLASAPEQARLEAQRHAEVLNSRSPRNAAEWLDRRVMR